MGFRPAIIRGFGWERNIVYFPNGTFTGIFTQGNWVDYEATRFDSNIYWAGGSADRVAWKFPNESTWPQWREQGQ